MSDRTQAEPKRKDPFPVYPLALAVFPVLSVYSANLELVPPSQTLRALVVSFAAGLLLYLGFSAIWRNLARGAMSASVCLLWVWSHQWLYGWFASWAWLVPPMGFYAVAGVALAVLAGLRPIRPKVPNLAAGMVLGVVAVQLVWAVANPPRVDASPQGSVAVLPPGPRPDVFHIVLDGFGRQDQIQRVMGTDMGWFVEGLRERGFQVAVDARANYVQTEQSVSTALNMDFLQNLVPGADPNTTDRRYFDSLIKEPAAVKRLMASGYSYIAMGSQFEGLRLGRHEVAPAREGGINLFEGILLDKTPWSAQEAFHESRYDRHRDTITGLFRRLEQLAEPTGTPRVVFAHILAPHPPFVFGPHGESVRQRGPFGFWDGSDYMQWVGTPEDYREGYAAQVQHVARMTLRMVDALLEGNRRDPPVIVIQGDHGSKLGLHQESLEQTDLAESFAILYALHSPPSLPMEVEPNATPVNTYRKLFRAMGVRDLPDLPNRSWHSPHSYPFRFVEVTNSLGRQTQPSR